MPAGSGSADRDRVRLAEAVVDEDEPDRAGELRALRLRGEGADAARGEHDLARQRALRQRADAECSGRSPSRTGATRPACRRCPSSWTRRRSSGRASTRRPGSFAPPAPWIGTAPSDGGPPTTESAGANTCEFDVAATAIASGAHAGRARRAEAEVLAVVAGRDHRHDAGERDVVDRLEHRVVRPGRSAGRRRRS